MTPFDDIRDLIAKIPELTIPAGDDVDAFYAERRIGTLQPLGRMAAAVSWLADMQGRPDPRITRPLIAVFAGSHSVASAVMGEEDVVSAAQARVDMLTQGAAGVRGFASSQNAAFKVFEMGIGYPAADIRTEPSLSERDCAAAIAFGMEVVAEGADLIVLGNAGYGSAAAAASIARGLYGGTSAYWAGGTGSVAEQRISAVEAALNTHGDFMQDPLEILRRFGGRDLAGMVGAILACAHQNIPVLLDGYVVCAAAAILHAIAPEAVRHCYAAHMSAEPAHGALLDRIGKSPILDMGFGIGDGSGGAAALSILRGAAEANAIYQEV